MELALSIIYALIVLVVLPLVWGFICRNIMKKKGRSPAGGFLLGFFVRLLGLIIALCLSNEKNRYSQIAWVCPNCNTINNDDGKFCIHCGEKRIYKTNDEQK